MPKEEKYALYKIGRPEDTFPKLTQHAYCMTNRLNGHHVWVPKSIVILDPPDDVGVRNFHIPLWFFKKNRVAPEAICEGDYRGIVGLII